MDPKNHFFERLKTKALVFFVGINIYLIEKYFSIVWWYQPPEPPNGPPKSFFSTAYARVLVFLISVDI